MPNLKLETLDRFKSFTPKGDLFGGVTTAIVSLPLALAFGVASGAGAEAGLWGAILVGLFAALFGGSSSLISEPTGPMTVIMTAVLTSMMAQYPEQGYAMAFTVVMMAGAFQILIGMLKLGKYVTLMPYSVVSGFMSGIGVILITLQLAPLMGQAAPPGGVSGTLQSLPSILMNLHFPELFLGLLTLSILFLMPAAWRKLCPPQLVALVAVTLLSVALFETDQIRRIGEIPSSLPSFVIPTFSPEMLTAMVIDAMALGTLGCIDTLLTAVIADSLTRKEHDSDKELRGQGIANLVAGMFGALPGAGATMGTVVNVQVGARSPVSGVLRALILLAVVLVAGGLTEPIPMAVLAGIAVYVGFNILDWSFLQRAHKLSLSQTFIMYGVMGLTVFVDLIVAVGLGVFISNIIVIERLSRVQEDTIKAISDSDNDVPLSPVEREMLDRANGKVLLFYLSGPMIFSVSKAIARQHQRAGNYQAMLLDLSDVNFLGVSSGLALENAIVEALDTGAKVFVLCPNAGARDRMDQMGISDRVGRENFVTSRIEGLTRALDSTGASTLPEYNRQPRSTRPGIDEDFDVG